MKSVYLEFDDWPCIFEKITACWLPNIEIVDISYMSTCPWLNGSTIISYQLVLDLTAEHPGSCPLIGDEGTLPRASLERTNVHFNLILFHTIQMPATISFLVPNQTVEWGCCDLSPACVCFTQMAKKAPGWKRKSESDHSPSLPSSPSAQSSPSCLLIPIVTRSDIEESWLVKCKFNQ